MKRLSQFSSHFSFWRALHSVGADFMAVFEPTGNVPRFMAFRIGDSVIGIGCLIGIGFLMATGLRK